VINPRSIQEVKDAVRIEEVLGEFLDLKRKGPRYLGLCPFHNEKTPSFNVSPQLGIYKCFGCGESGDAIKFLEKQEHLSFVEAIRWLGKRYGIELEEEEQSPEQQQEQSERESLGVVQQWALQWSVEQLWNSDEGKRIGLSYFRERGFRDDTIKEFQLGYVPEKGDAFATAAIAHGFTPELLEKAGWIKLRDNGNAWDFFQGRVTFPIHGLAGQPIGFGARTLKSDKKLPKYFNSPESVLYVKSRSLYGISYAKKAIVEQANCLLVEGYTDVISLHQAGIANVVASSGTSLTVEQVRLIKRYAQAITILYDGDAAGIKASLRGIDIVLKEGLNVKVVTFPEGEDPDSFAKSHSSSEVASYLEEGSVDFILFRAKLLMEEAGGDPFKKAELVKETVQTLSFIQDSVLRGTYITPLSQILKIQEQALITEANKERRKERVARLRKEQNEEGISEYVVSPEFSPPEIELEDLGTTPQERDLLRMLISYGHERVIVPFQDSDGEVTEEDTSVAELMFQSLAQDDITFDEPLLQAIYRDYSFANKMGTKVEPKRYVDNENEEWRSLAIDLLTHRHVLSPNWEAKHKIHVTHENEQLLGAVEHGLNMLKERRVDRMLREKQEQIKDMTDDADVEMALRTIMALNQAKKEFAKLTGRVVVG
jgi:DNA primase